jgi:carboxyl-terminal processing protease
VNNHAEIGESALPNALAWDTVPAAKYDAVNQIPPVLPELKKKSEARVAADKDFAYIRDEITRFKKAKEEKTVSLNEQQRMKEKEEMQARADARKKELRARPDPKYKTYEITLKNANLPGLPPPMVKTNTVADISAKPSNTVVKAETKISDDDEESKDEPPVPTVDSTLDEGWRILRDLVTLTKGNTLVGKN